MPVEHPQTKITIYSISKVNSWIRRRVEEGNHHIWVRGEISNFSRSRPGHLYFTLKDEHSQIQAVVWKKTANTFAFELKDNLQIVAECRVRVYEKKGEYSLELSRAYLIDREGALRQAFLQLYNRLKSEGLFDYPHKKAFPKLPQRIAIVTSAEGAALWDIWTTLKNRFSRLSILLFPVLVQGKYAPKSIVEALEELNRRQEVEIIILTRGGGSLEDLQAFNEESVARAIFASKIPVLSAIGHESDVTIADYVADGRALTPTDAGVRCVPDEKELRQQLAQFQTRLEVLLQKNLQVKKLHLQSLQNRYGFQYPQQKIQQLRKELTYLQEKLERSLLQKIEQDKKHLHQQMLQLESLNPLTILKRGFSLTTRENHQIVRAPEDVSHGETLRIDLANGHLFVKVKEPEDGRRRELDPFLFDF